jgi:hypothetical protein
MPIMEALPALQNKAIDGVITGSTVASTLKYYDVAKYMTHLPRSMIFVSAADSDDPGQGFQFEGGHHSNRRRAVLPVGTFMGSQRW